MSQPRSKEREQELKKFIKRTKGIAYATRAIKWFQEHLGEIVTSKELAQLTGKDNLPIQHSMRRVFELRDEQGYEIINWKDKNPLGPPLKVDEWILLKKKPNPKKIRARGVNKRIMFEVFTRDGYQCQFCGRTPQDDDPFKAGHKIKLHVGHIKAHKQDGSVEIENMGEMIEDHTLTADDFVTMCNVCNEGLKNKNLKLMNNLELTKSRINKLSEEEKAVLLASLGKELDKN